MLWHIKLFLTHLPLFPKLVYLLVDDLVLHYGPSGTVAKVSLERITRILGIHCSVNINNLFAFLYLKLEVKDLKSKRSLH